MTLKAALLLTVLSLGGSTGARAPQLGWDRGDRVLRWYDPATLAPVAKAKLSYQSGLCSWSFTPDRRRLAVSDCGGSLRLFALHPLRRLGTVAVSGPLSSLADVAWVRPDRVLAVARVGSDASSLIVVDPTSRRVVRRVDLSGLAGDRAIVGTSMVFLVSPAGRFGAPSVVVAAADGSIRSATIDRFSAGSVISGDGSDASASSRVPGFAVDPAGRAFVVAPDLTVAQVDLDTMAVSYHGATRVLAKAINGPERVAAWLGSGLVAVSGADYSTTPAPTPVVQVTPFGLHVLDTRTWSYRTIDPNAQSLWPTRTGVLATYGSARVAVGYGLDGSQRFRLDAGDDGYLSMQGTRAYACRAGWAVAVYDTNTGSRVGTPHKQGCHTLLAGRSSLY